MNLDDLISQSESILILGHHNADPDAICSMIAIKELCEAIKPPIKTTLACDDISRVATQVMNTFYPDIEVSDSIDSEYDFIIVLDTNSRFQLGPELQDILNQPSRTFIIDHHEENPEVHKIADHLCIQSERFSTCEILVGIFDELGIEISKSVANLLLTGMLFDTRRFFYADAKSFDVVRRLFESGADYSSCLNSLIVRPDRSERIARLKAAGRLKIHTIDEWIVVTSKIGAYEASACRAILVMGADVAIIGGKPSKKTVRLSSRSTSEFSQTTGVNLGTDVMEPLGQLINGEGGGHPNAAGANGTENRDAALERSVELIRQAILRNRSSEE